MMLPPFQLHQPSTVEAAVTLAAGFTEAGVPFDWVAGGTDLLPNYKWRLNPHGHVISLAAIEALSRLDAGHVGAMVRLHDLATGDAHPLLAEVAGTIASVMIRRSGTVGGNICLDTRCFWYNQTEDWRRSIDWCHKCDMETGADCRVIPNQNHTCVATYQGDLAAAFLALDATIHLAGPAGARSLPVVEFFALDGITKNVLGPGEMVTHLTLPEDAAEWSGAYQKLRLRESWDFPEAGVAVAWRDGRVEPGTLRVATTGLESIPRRHDAEVAAALAEAWTGQASAQALGEAVRKVTKPVHNTWFKPRYRRSMVPVLVRRALEDIGAA